MSNELNADSGTSSPTFGNNHVVRSPLLSDFLHLYLGCNVIIEKSNYWLVHEHSIHKGNIKTLTPQLFYLINRFGKKSVVKLILRPLETMSAKEDKEAWNIWNDDFVKKAGTNCGIAYEAGKIKYLLSKHFDCFGLIGNGLAIDARAIEANELHKAGLDY